MKTGQQVAVCHDGKWGRRVIGKIIETRRGHHIKVQFHEPITDSIIEFWARKESHIRHLRKKSNSGISYGKVYGKWGGWIRQADIFCPWFAVYKWQEKS